MRSEFIGTEHYLPAVSTQPVPQRVPSEASLQQGVHQRPLDIRPTEKIIVYTHLE